MVGVDLSQNNLAPLRCLSFIKQLTRLLRWYELLFYGNHKGEVEFIFFLRSDEPVVHERVEKICESIEIKRRDLEEPNFESRPSKRVEDRKFLRLKVRNLLDKTRELMGLPRFDVHLLSLELFKD